LWSSNEAILRQSLERYPDALAMRLGLAELEMNRFPPDLDAAQAHYRHLLGLERPSIRLIGAAGMVASSCHFGSPADESAVATLNSEIPDTLEADFLGAMTALTEILIATDCAAIRPAELALRVTQFLQGSKLSDESPFVWQLRYRAAQLFEHAGRQDEALEQAQAAWHERRDQIAVGMMILRLELESGRQDAAAKLLESLTKLVDDRAMPAKNMLDQYRLMLEKETASPEP
jgi:tetratricopeptide (TPR) repeat protein